MIRRISSSLTITLIFVLSIQLQAQTPGNFKDYSILENTTKYDKVWIVDKNRKSAHDTNSGTEAAPLLTIGEALKRVQAGEKILIHKGEYREAINIRTGGKSMSEMIAIESVKGEKVTIKGSKKLYVDWVQELKLKKDQIKPSISKSISPKLWIARINDTVFKNYPNSLNLKNINKSEWGILINKSTPYSDIVSSLARGNLYQNGIRMVQVHHYGDLLHIEGSYWIDTDQKTIHIHPNGNTNPNDETFELSILDCLLQPVSNGINYVHVKNLVFEHCANSFAPTGSGALRTNGGHHWMFENNLVHEINSYGIELSPAPGQNIADSLFKENSHNQLLGNKLVGCGVAGIIGNELSEGIIKNNEIIDCAWHQAEHLELSAGIRLSEVKHCLISTNQVHFAQSGSGILLQDGCADNLVTKNILQSIASINGALVVKNTQAANLFNNNFLWSIHGVGINSVNSSYQLFYHNLIAQTTSKVIQIGTSKTNAAEDVRPTARDNQVVNNMLIDFGDRIESSSPSNVVSNNLFVFHTSIEMEELSRWKARIVSKRGLIMRADAGFNPKTLVFKWNSLKQIQPAPALTEVESDISDKARTKPMTIPGPFVTLPSNYEYYEQLIAD